MVSGKPRWVVYGYGLGFRGLGFKDLWGLYRGDCVGFRDMTKERRDGKENGK